MAITIDWATKVINVPRADMTLTQASPEVRELNLNDFRLELKAIEASEEGMPFLVTHRHNTEVTLSGIVYARIIEIINGYTVTFEDGQYTVNAVGANSNISDVTNPNQVNLNTANAAGLINTRALEFASFNGVVTVDATSSFSGTVYPTGTPQQPVNNIPDAILIAETRGLTALKIIGDYTFDTGDNIEGYIVSGENASRSTLTFNSGSDTLNVDLRDATITGTLDTDASFTRCTVQNLSTVRGDFNDCILEGIITLSGTGQSSFYNCSDGLVAGAPPPAIDFNGSAHALAIRDYDGDIALRNKTSAEAVEININSGGTITLENTVTAGNIRLTGLLKVEDNSNGATIDITQVMFPDQAQLAAFGGKVSIDVNNGTAGTQFPQGTHQFPVNNLADAITIANSRGIDYFEVDGTLVITDTDISGYTFIGENRLTAVVVLSGAGNTTTNTTFERMILTGRVNGHIYCHEVALQTLSNIGSDVFPTIFRYCLFRADVGATPCIQFNNSVTDIDNVHFVDCASAVPGNGSATVDVNGSDAPIAFRRYSGGIKLINYTAGQASTFQIGGDGGKLTVDNTNTNGFISFRGGGTLLDTSGAGFTIEVEDAYALKVDETHKLYGLDPDNPATITPTQRTAGDIDITIGGDGETISTLTRQ